MFWGLVIASFFTPTRSWAQVPVVAQSSANGVTDTNSRDFRIDPGGNEAAENFIRLERWLAIETERVRWYDDATERLERAAETVRSGLSSQVAQAETTDRTQSKTSVLDFVLQLNQFATHQKAVVDEKVTVQRAMLDVVLDPKIDLPNTLESEIEQAAPPTETQPSETQPAESADSEIQGEESSSERETTPAVLNPLQAVLGTGEDTLKSTNESAVEATPDTFDPYLFDIEAELADTIEKLEATNRQAALQTRAIRLCELDSANVLRWIELAQAASSGIATSSDEPASVAEPITPNPKASLDAEASENDVPEKLLSEGASLPDLGLEKHQQWKLFLDQQLEAWEASRLKTVEKISLLESEIASLRMRTAFLRSPLAPHRIQRWLFISGPYALSIIVLGVLAWLVSRPIISRVARTVAKHRRTGTLEERQERAETLRRMIQGMINLALLTFGALALLDQFGVDVTVLLGGAAVLGMAIAFGAQNLIKDYFGGLLILTENQYRVGNVIRVGSIAGLVEDVSLRMTVLRDLEGVAHFIPHGQITTVSNLSHGWSRAVLDIGVAYKEDVDRVLEVLREVTDHLFEDLKYGELLLDRAEILGVDKFGDSAVVVKLMVKTRPLKQWEVKRELLRRIKNRFDELGIEIPFPHRTVYHRGEAENLAMGFAEQSAGH